MERKFFSTFSFFFFYSALIYDCSSSYRAHKRFHGNFSIVLRPWVGWSISPSWIKPFLSTYSFTRTCVYLESGCLYAELLNISRRSRSVPYEFCASPIQRNNKFLFQLVPWNFTSVFPRNCTPYTTILSRFPSICRIFPPFYISHGWITFQNRAHFSIEETFYTRSYSSRLFPPTHNINSISTYRSIRCMFILAKFRPRFLAYHDATWYRQDK